MKISNKYDYQPIAREDTPNGRFYISPLNGNRLPSITTILSATNESAYLAEWVARVGEVEAEKQRTIGTNIGTAMHTMLENFIMELPNVHRNNMINMLADRMSKKIIKNAFPDISEIWGIETGLYYKDLYAGTSDLIGVYNGKPTIMDYKNAKTMKTAEQITDYFCQGSAYAKAHNSMYGTDINQVAIFMVDRELNYKTFVVAGTEMDKYTSKWDSKVEAFYNK